MHAYHQPFYKLFDMNLLFWPYECSISLDEKAHWRQENEQKWLDSLGDSWDEQQERGQFPLSHEIVLFLRIYSDAQWIFGGVISYQFVKDIKMESMWPIWEGLIVFCRLSFELEFERDHCIHFNDIRFHES